jgi:nitrogen regulatory protein PII-like uncharacterized protein
MSKNNFESLTVNELKFASKLFRIDLGNLTKKADIISLFNAAGFTFEDYLAETGSQFTHTETEEKKEPVVEVVQKPETDKVVDSTKSESIILKMVHPRSSLNVSNKAYFTIEEPFQVFKKELAEEILKLGKDEVRLATPEEVKSFYRV